jgi:ankyrin repeat protein
MPSPILDAVYRGRLDELDALLSAKPSLTICEAAAIGDTARVRALARAKGSALAERSDDGWTALHLASHFGRTDTVAALLAAGADVHARSTNRMCNHAIHAAAAGSAAVVVVTQLLAAGADVNAPQGGGFTALHEAAFKGDTALAELLLAHGADTARRTDEGQTAETIAAAQGHAALARRLRGEQP